MWKGDARILSAWRWLNRKDVKQGKKAKGATQPGILYEFPWEFMGSYKYLLFLPFLYVVCSGQDDADNWCYHMLVIAGLRYAQSWVWNFLSRNHNLTDRTRIQDKGLDFNQVDREDNWDDYIILQAIVASIVHYLPFLYCSNGVCHAYKDFPLYDNKGLIKLILIHMGPTEFIYYWLHRALHIHSLYAKYHSHHHASFVTEAISGSVHPFMEHLMYTANFAIPLVGTWLAGGASISMFYLYLLGFDLLNMIGHCNFEFFPVWPFRVFPWLKYLIYTPSFHSLHHSRVHTNFCLFMPLYDYMYGTLDDKSWDLFYKAAAGVAVPHSAPSAVFLAHGTEFLSVFHLPFMTRSFAAHPFRTNLIMYILWPLCLPLLLVIRLIGRVFIADKHKLLQHRIETWVTPAFAMEFFFRSQWPRINSYIEDAIMSADAAGVKVFGLGALNKNEALNGGGSLFVKKHPDLRLRLVHGNTLTAAAVLHKIPRGVEEAFVVGATSKLGRAISLYLARKGVKVTMMTQSRERFEGIRSDCPAAYRGNLKHSLSIEDGRNCSCWVVGRFLTPAEQKVAPRGTTFHQFVVPPLPELRKDCSYTSLPAFTLPDSATGFRSCEMTMERRNVHACHAGALVHLLEGWTHHEVGAIDPDRIDVTWEAAERHGFRLVPDKKIC
uniref:Fatty acid hydroxylase domain-containing protein n=1 Tax=Guillardia theta TaxID=55529 RepID=A0A7S4PEJ6_GUITH|mmetsp:Transcript_4935/g.17880  ORF Transcript_4935/g.17880 Transcript_4935/m.17880 type:complete len:663 (+) Transcript_4935:101-2089(+)